MADTIQQIVDVYVDYAQPRITMSKAGELVERVGIDPFKEHVMANHHILDSQGGDISAQDNWLALSTDTLPGGIALSEITLLELLHRQESLRLSCR